MALASRAVFFEKGKVLADAPIDEIVRRFDWTAGYDTPASEEFLRYSAQRRL